MFTNYLVMFSFRSFIKILVGDYFNKMVQKLSHGDSRARASRSYLALVEVQLVDHRFGSSRLEDGRSSKRLRYPCLVLCLDPFVKIRQLICSSSQYTLVACFGIGFHEQIDQNKFKWFFCILDVFDIHTCFISQTNLF